MPSTHHKPAVTNAAEFDVDSHVIFAVFVVNVVVARSSPGPDYRHRGVNSHALTVEVSQVGMFACSQQKCVFVCVFMFVCVC